jgi:excinuclease ABC subunit C
MSQDKPTFNHKTFLETLTHRPGVYRMLNQEGQVLYVGKAKDLSRRVSSYFTKASNKRIAMMVSQIADIAITVTQTESEALLLENNLIKEHQPRYNVLLRDDKSYPYIFLSDDEFPRLSFHRGAKNKPGQFFGPYPSSGAVRETLKLLQKLFPVRQCENSYYANRSRPCLQYQIGRCTAPCVGFVSDARYAQDVRDTVLFLQGRAFDVVDRWVTKMQQASEDLAFEEAAKLRDQIQALRSVQEKQYITGERGDLDIVAVAKRKGVACLQVFFIRQGHNLGNKTLYPRTGEGAEAAELIAAFISQYYLHKAVPGEILVNVMPDDRSLLEDILSSKAGRKVSIKDTARGERARWLKMAQTNAEMGLQARLQSSQVVQQRLDALAEALNLDEAPQRMECFDISHTQGEKTVASCVVFQEGAPLKKDYRRFNIKGITGGDDYAAMRQALHRRYQRIQREEGIMPDLLLIDGGQGQLTIARQILSALGINEVMLLGVAKGPDRKPGMEQLFLNGQQQPLILPSHSPALHLIQHIRDEAHRFAIAGHRQQRAKARKTSPLEEIDGIGAKRRQRLLTHFGGIQGLARAGIEDIAKVDGISKTLAHHVYVALHGEE